MAWGGSLNKEGSDHLRNLRKADSAVKFLEELKRKLNDKEKQKVMIEYYALRDKSGKYIGCLEASQNISEIQKINGEKRLLD